MDARDGILIREAQQGSLDAFSTLVERNWSAFVRFARSVAGDAEAEDLVQESLVVAWEKLASLRHEEAFHAWVLRIVARRCFRVARRRARLLPIAAALDPADPGSSRPAEAFHVERVLSLLPPRQRAVMHLTVVEGMSDTEIGLSLGIEASSVRSHRRRARDLLRRALCGLKMDGGNQP